MYIKTTYKYADIVEVNKHYSSQYGNHSKRDRRRKRSEKSVKATNDRRRNAHMFRILVANFQDGSFRATLTHKEPPENAKEEMNKFLRIMRREARKAGHDLKYIYVTEKTKRGKIRHHIVMNVADTELMRKNWKGGDIKITSLYMDKDYRQLADCLEKQQEENKSHYHGSKNLTIPKPETEIISA